MSNEVQYIPSEGVASIKHKIIPILKESDIIRFWGKVKITANDNHCWEWIGRSNSPKKSYGAFDLITGAFAAHRISYLINNKKDPKEKGVLHTCDNPKCVNPKHLFLGTNNDNIRDKVLKNRQARNVAWNKGRKTDYYLWNNSMCKATEEDFIKMKYLYENEKISVNNLAKEFGVSKKAVSTSIRRMGGFVPTVHTKLTIEQVCEIKRRIAEGPESRPRLHIEFSVTRKTIDDIFKGKTWNK